MSPQLNFQAIGECMVEIVRVPGGHARIGYSGDAYNTAVYLHRVAAGLGMEVQTRFLTGLGDDAESALMRERWNLDRIEADVVVIPGSGPGLYLISTDETGERSFAYWRGGSAAAQLFGGNGWIDRVHGSTVYLSGISLQLMTETGRKKLIDRLASLRAEGTQIVFDSNFREVGWESVEQAGEAMRAVFGVTDVALVTLDDEVALGNCTGVESCAERLRGLGVAEIVIKDGANGVWIADADTVTQVPARPVEPVDTTAAGDSFNGAYLAARAAGAEPRRAAVIGNAVAEQVVLSSGAIIGPDQMPVLAR